LPNTFSALTNNSILEVAPPKVGADEPACVRAEIVLNTKNIAEHVRRDWDSLFPGDLVYLIEARPLSEEPPISNGHTFSETARLSGLRRLRTAEVVQLVDENGRAIRDKPVGTTNGYSRSSGHRKLIVNLDTSAYKADEDRKSKGKADVYEAINVIVRRRGRENNFKRILESIKSLTLSDVQIPTWFQEVFLGYGNPSGASYKELDSRLQKLDFRDTFIDRNHLLKSFPDMKIEFDNSQHSETGPPFVLEIIETSQPNNSKVSKKRRRDEKEEVSPKSAKIRVSTYKEPNSGPYPTDVPKLNRTIFTPAQVEAIQSGTQPGLTLIVGPPGTGKTDVATQIISNIYHNFPMQRTLMIAHSNQALNQLFQKITKLDIDDRHLLRLGHGEEALETDVSYGKEGRVESFLDNRARYLSEVDKLAYNLGASGAHGNSCETAGYFKSVYVTPAWTKFWDIVASNHDHSDIILSSFPFYQYFQDAPQPLFPPGASIEEILEIAKGCERHIEKVFAELEDIRPFEILRGSRDKANYLLIKEARIIAMTSTHAAMRRQEISDLGFHYDNVVMEEAAQITEIENFIPLALQHPKNGELPLQRIVLCGDHLQNSPIIQNLAFRQYANLEQSLFLRLVRLGVPVINLDQQGRARPSIAELYKWRYSKLGDLPNVMEGSEFKTGNAGFRYDYQFINVPDYKGAGEMQPSPHFIQNLGEAEYAVAIYQYMRLLGYPASKISILTTYAGQKALVRDVLGHRCARNSLFGLPRIVTTVDKYQGEQNDCKYTIPKPILHADWYFRRHSIVDEDQPCWLST
jgi:intron-binding protein aquarius